MAKRKRSGTEQKPNGAALGFEAKLWLAADKLQIVLPRDHAHASVDERRPLRKHDYLPDKQEKATRAVLEQAGVRCKDWSARVGLMVWRNS